MSLKDTCVCAWETLPAVIAANNANTDKINLGGLRLFGIVMPAAWTAANLTFQASLDGGTTWNNVKDATGAEVTVVASASDCVVWLPAAFSALPMLKLRSGPAAAPVNQAADRTLQLILRSV